MKGGAHAFLSLSLSLSYCLTNITTEYTSNLVVNHMVFDTYAMQLLSVSNIKVDTESVSD